MYTCICYNSFYYVVVRITTAGGVGEATPGGCCALYNGDFSKHPKTHNPFIHNVWIVPPTVEIPTTFFRKGIDIMRGVCYSYYMRTKKGIKFNKREVVGTTDGRLAQPNQWQANPRQMDWLNFYMNPKEKDTYGNPYQAAIKAGYSESYAAQIMSPSLALQWVQSAKNIMRTMNTEHIRSVLEDIAVNKMEKASDRIAASKLLGMDQGMFVQKQITAHVGLEQALAELE